MELIFASHNKGKLKEVKAIFKSTNFIIKSLDEIGFNEEIEETGSTFEENALIKARKIFSILNKPVIADDSGLMVEQLNGEPGIYSARFAGENCTYEDNNKKLLKILKSFPEPHYAKFVCCAAYIDSSNEIIEYGYLEGKIINEQKGKNGFGYDPIFQPLEPNYEKTLAELSPEEKNKISHRSKSFGKLKNHLLKLTNK